MAVILDFSPVTRDTQQETNFSNIFTASSEVSRKTVLPVADPDLQVGGQSQKKFFRLFAPQLFGLKIRGGGRPPGPLR